MTNRPSNDTAADVLAAALGLASSEAPFPWQLRLLDLFLDGSIPQALDLPTGLGKTATIAVWLVARALGAPVPRRLIYVVDRRAVVDQATEVAESLHAWVQTNPAIADSLGLGSRTLPISTLRGQHVDNRAWLEDPSLPAIVVGTVDMVGSRLLFSGYSVSSKMRPYHAGLLGVDALVVLDEAHLVPAFEDLLRQIERGADLFGPKEPSLRALLPPFRLLSLSATGRQTDVTTLTLSDKDRGNRIVRRRLTARKTLSIVELANVELGAAPASADDTGETIKKSKRPKLTEVLAKQAWELTEKGSANLRCLVFCNARRDAVDVAEELRSLATSTSTGKPIIELFVGGRRVKERIEARDALARSGFLAGINANLEQSSFLIATSAGEVGVDLDADHMVCDLVAWERMVQRLGRVNRRGDGDAKIVVVVDSEPTASDGTMKAIEKRDACNAAKEQLDELTSRLSALQGERAPIAKGQKKSADAKAADEKRQQAEKELKKMIATCRKRVDAFKDADAKIVARHETAVAQYRALRMLLDTVVQSDGNLSPDSLLTLRNRQDLAQALRDATTVEPLRPELTRALVDAWSLTSLDEHSGRPDVAPWLRGFPPEDDKPQTTVLWRLHLPVLTDGALNPKAVRRFFEAAPPHASEQLETETHLVRGWLIERAVAAKSAGSLDAKRVAMIALGPRGEVRAWRSLAELAAAKSQGKNESLGAKKAREQGVKELEKLLVGATIIIDARLGGLNNGLLSDRTNTPADASDDSSTTWLVRPDAPGVPVTGFRIRVLGGEDDENEWRATPGAGWVRRHLFVTRVVDSEPSEALAIDGWGGDAATEEERAEANRPQALDEHQSWTEDSVRQLAGRVGIDEARTELLALAARLHDEGKRAAKWQRAFKAPADGRPYAKTKGPIDFSILDGYRHELGSLPYVETYDGFKKLSEDDQDFVLHVVAAHHGFARPIIGTRGCDLPQSLVDARARKVALRFARLSRCWGPWGLAWWEALLRSADQTASRRNLQTAMSHKDRLR